MRSLAVLCGLVISIASTVTGCGAQFGHSALWRDARTFEENLGGNRYVYHLTAFVDATPTTNARPVISETPDGAVEVGAISVAVQLGAWGFGGLRRSETEFFDQLAVAAARLGAGTTVAAPNIEMADLDGDGRLEVAVSYGAALTVAVLRAPPAP